MPFADWEREVEGEEKGGEQRKEMEAEEGNSGRKGEMRGGGMRQSNRHRMTWDHDN